MSRNSIYIHLFALLLLLTACGQKRQEPVVTPWGEITDTIPTDDDFDLDDIQRNGELIALTLTGPETYYDYRGRHLGTHYLLCQRFADKLGVSLRMEVCRDTAEMLQRLTDGEADIICFPLSKKGLGWKIGADKEDLEKELQQWYRPTLMAEVKKQEEYLLSSRSVRRRVFAPMLNRASGVISHCACGLMQIMPGTADHLGLARADIYNPEKNIAAAVKYIAELEQSFSDIRDRSERTKFVLAAYNGGGYHIRDAMALARKHGREASRWRDVEPFVLGLQRAEYYNDPVVRNGYMRGSETVSYVRRIHERWNGYRGIKTVHSVSAGPTGIPQKAKRERKAKYQVTE